MINSASKKTRMKNAYISANRSSKCWWVKTFLVFFLKISQKLFFFLNMNKKTMGQYPFFRTLRTDDSTFWIPRVVTLYTGTLSYLVSNTSMMFQPNIISNIGNVWLISYNIHIKCTQLKNWIIQHYNPSHNEQPLVLFISVMFQSDSSYHKEKQVRNKWISSIKNHNHSSQQ